MRRLALAFIAALLCPALSGFAAEPVAFPSATIDLGTCVTDIEKSVRFYTEGIGFREVPGFAVPAELAAAAGLTDTKPLAIAFRWPISRTETKHGASGPREFLA